MTITDLHNIIFDGGSNERKGHRKEVSNGS